MELAATDKIIAGTLADSLFVWKSIQFASVGAFAHPAWLTEDHFRNIKSENNLSAASWLPSDANHAEPLLMSCARK